METVHAVTAPNSDRKVVAYLSAEFLTGPHLGNNLLCLGLRDAATEAVSGLGQSLADLLDQEEEPGLGNGGLGRLAACYMDSLATLGVPAIGYGIRYEFGIFDQAIRDGWQVELTDKWLRLGNPWEIARPELAIQVPFGGRTEQAVDEDGRLRVRWIPATVVRGVPYDTVVPGYLKATANLLRLWRAEAVESFNFEAFNVGDYYGAVTEKISSETISKVLYPNDEPEAGKHLRLAAAVLLRLLLAAGHDPHPPGVWPRASGVSPSHWAVQLNDTHPSLAIAELMRLLVDVHGMDWETAWTITGQSCGYTNHTLLSEALEKWPVPLFGSLLPRHLEIVFEINRRFLDEVRRRFPGDDALVQRLSIIDESGDKSRAHGASGQRRQPRHQRRGRAPYPARSRRPSFATSTGLPGSHRQCHQRRDAAAVDRARQPRAERADQRSDRRPLALEPRGGAGAARAARNRCRASRLRGGRSRPPTSGGWPR